MRWWPVLLGLGVVGAGVAFLSGGGGVVEFTAATAGTPMKPPSAILLYADTPTGRLARKVIDRVSRDPQLEDVSFAAMSQTTLTALVEQHGNVYGMDASQIAEYFAQEGFAGVFGAAGAQGVSLESFSIADGATEEDLEMAMTNATLVALNVQGRMEGPGVSVPIPTMEMVAGMLG